VLWLTWVVVLLGAAIARRLYDTGHTVEAVVAVALPAAFLLLVWNGRRRAR